MMRNEDPEFRIKIPDSDAYNWITLLREANFSQAEIDEIMTYLNDTYAKGRLKPVFQRELKVTEARWRQEFRRAPMREDREALERLTLEHLRSFSIAELEKRKW